LKGETHESKTLEKYNYVVIMIACHGNEKDEILDCIGKTYELSNLYNAHKEGGFME